MRRQRCEGTGRCTSSRRQWAVCDTRNGRPSAIVTLPTTPSGVFTRRLPGWLQRPYPNLKPALLHPIGTNRNPRACVWPLSFMSRARVLGCTDVYGSGHGHPPILQKNRFIWPTHKNRKPGSLTTTGERRTCEVRPLTITAGRTGCWLTGSRMRPKALATTSESRPGAGPSRAARNPCAWGGRAVGHKAGKSDRLWHQGRSNDDPQRSWRPSRERLRVTSSAYSRWPPTGRPCARRVRRMPWGLTRRAR